MPENSTGFCKIIGVETFRRLLPHRLAKIHRKHERNARKQDGRELEPPLGFRAGMAAPAIQTQFALTGKNVTAAAADHRIAPGSAPSFKFPASSADVAGTLP